MHDTYRHARHTHTEYEVGGDLLGRHSEDIRGGHEKVMDRNKLYYKHV